MGCGGLKRQAKGGEGLSGPPWGLKELGNLLTPVPGFNERQKPRRSILFEPTALPLGNGTRFLCRFSVEAWFRISDYISLRGVSRTGTK